MTEADKNTLKSVWLWIKYVIFTAFIVNYFDILYGGYLWLLFVVLASICNATMDTLDHHFSTSIFKKLNQKFWNPIVSSDSAYRIGGYKIDAWHLTKSSMVIFLALSAVFHTNKNFWYVDVCLFGWAWNVTFSLFYDIILRRK